MAVEYARKYLAVGKECYRKIWYKHLEASRWSNLIQLCKLVFSLPFTTRQVEQLKSSRPHAGPASLPFTTRQVEQLKSSRPHAGPAYTLQHSVTF